MTRSVLVAAEQDNGELRRVSWEAIAAARQLTPARLMLAVLGASAAGILDQTQQVDEVWPVEHPLLARYASEAYTTALRQLIEELKPEYVVFPHTYQCCDFAPMLAGKAPPLAPGGVDVVEKAAELGMHTLSGAVMDPRALLELFDRAEQPQVPMGTPVSSEHIWWLTRGQGYRLPYIPSFLRNGGNRVLSLGHLVGWLASYAERLGINVITGTAPRSLLIEENKVAGLYTDDKGIDKSGRRKAHFQPGSELRSRVVVLAEGPRGSRTKQLTEHFKLNEGCNP